VSTSGVRLGTFLHEQLAGQATARGIKRELERGCCRVNGQLERHASRRLATGDRVRFRWGGDPVGRRRLEITAAAILHEDERYLVLDKPAGYPSHPTVDPERPDVQTHLLQYLERRDGGAYLAQVHRLDRDTSGALLHVKRPDLVDPVTDLFRQRRVEKCYLALVRGVLRPPTGTWSTRLRRRRGPGGVECWGSGAGRGSRSAVTDYAVLEVMGGRWCLVQLHPRTGRTHQLRVHLLEAGHPILGDLQYGGDAALPEGWQPERHMLHASNLAFDDPAGHGPVAVTAPVPADFRAAHARLGGSGSPG
jgi:RluA family pseudouridine synthase